MYLKLVGAKEDVAEGVREGEGEIHGFSVGCKAMRKGYGE